MRVGAARCMSWVRERGSRRIPVVGSCEMCLRLSVLLKALHGAVDLDEGRFDGKHNVGWEDGLGVHGPGDGPLPRLQHLLHLASNWVIDPRVRLHECAVQLGRDVQCVRSSDILDNGV